MIARVSLEIALRKEFDYFVPPELERRVDVGSRVQVPFGPRKVLGVVTAIAEESAHVKLKPIVRALDRGVLLLRAGNCAQVGAAGSRAQRSHRLA
jgi:primosomal protein N' (replication factor Y)